MTDKKPTDSEIIKALECCNKPRGKRDCEKCHYFFSDIKCKTHLLIDALDLINCLQAENERLSRFGGILVHNGSELFKELQTAKAEAYKEFAERLKSRFLNKNEVINNTVDNLLKELVGENK